MLAFLFRGLTAQRPDSTALFDALTRETRRPDWYIDCGVADTFDGRFAVLATVTALALVRLERDGDAGNRASVALTERFVEVMESEHRQLGIGDPTLGRVVRKLVGMVARRTDLWRTALTSGAEWSAATRESLYKSDVPDRALRHSAQALHALWQRLERAPLDRLEQGEIG